jgi:tagatose-1,6-bisphosphate aldolase
MRRATALLKLFRSYWRALEVQQQMKLSHRSGAISILIFAILQGEKKVLESHKREFSWESSSLEKVKVDVSVSLYPSYHRCRASAPFFDYKLIP